MAHAWGVFYCPSHDYESDHKLIEAMQPSVVTIQDGGDNHYDWIRKAAPNTIILAREWALGDQWSDLERDPVATGKHHASEWAKKRDKLKFDPEMARVAPVNEPLCWPTLDPDKYSPKQREAQRVERIKKINAYTVTFAGECEKYGLRAALLKLSVGWPGNTGPDTPPNWKEYEETYKNVNWKRHTMCLHEYFADLGPAEHWGWWGGRARKMPWDVPYIIGECGFEMAVKKTVEPAYRGWTRYISRAQYAQMMLDYCNWMAVDPRLLGTCFFMLDHQDPQWASQDYSACWQEIIAIKPQLRQISTEKFVPLPANVLSPDKFKQPTGTGAPPPAPPPVVVPPPVTPPTPPPPAPVTTLTGKIASTRPNDGTTYVYGKAPKGSKVFFSWRGSDPAAEPYVVKGDGTFNMPIFRNGKTPCAGDWDIWAVADGKTSARVQFTTDGKGGTKNQIEVNFTLTTVPVTPPVVPPVVEPPVGTPAATPLRWPLDVLRVTQWWGRTHGGIDYGIPEGTPVKACADGVVAWVDDDRKTSAVNGGYGLYIRIAHPTLKINTFYAHLSRQDVKVGDKVTLGQVIGLSGNTGNSTGPHLHFEVRLTDAAGKYDNAAAGDMANGRIDPMAFVAGFERGGGKTKPPFETK